MSVIPGITTSENTTLNRLASRASWSPSLTTSFQALGETISFGEMDPARKDEISHRARAFAQLKAALL